MIGTWRFWCLEVCVAVPVNVVCVTAVGLWLELGGSDGWECSDCTEKVRSTSDRNPVARSRSLPAINVSFPCRKRPFPVVFSRIPSRFQPGSGIWNSRPGVSIEWRATPTLFRRSGSTIHSLQWKEMSAVSSKEYRSLLPPSDDPFHRSSKDDDSFRRFVDVSMCADTCDECAQPMDFTIRHAIAGEVTLPHDRCSWIDVQIDWMDGQRQH